MIDAAEPPRLKHLSTLAVATLTTGIVMVHGFAGVHEAAEHIMGHPVWTHELPDARDRIAELVVAQVPNFPTEPPQDFRAMATDLVARYGETIEIERGSNARGEDPVSSLSRMMEGAGR